MPLLFLSHSSVDKEGARKLKRTLREVLPDWEVWFDEDDLPAGTVWLKEIEAAINRSAAFLVYVGKQGIENIVLAEAQLAWLLRASRDSKYLFIPFLSAAAPKPEALPGFVRLYQCLTGAELQRLFEVLRGVSADDGRRGVVAPFFGLRPIDERRSHLFFGREAETQALIERVFEQPLVLVSGDSGAGKSSLVRAGLVPRFRSGDLATLAHQRPDDPYHWHVVLARPLKDPWEGLGDAIAEAARPLIPSALERAALARSAASGEWASARRALRCDLPPEQTTVLLIVDQFEEIFTLTPPGERESFVAFLLDLTKDRAHRFHVVLTIRHDYVNLCRSLDALRERLDGDHRRARFVLGSMSEDGLRRVVIEPLRLADVGKDQRELLAKHILEEVGERPGDLALVQMALTRTWQERAKYPNLVEACVAVGGVEGALAQAAEQVRQKTPSQHTHQPTPGQLDVVLLRLVRLGDTGGATRRPASRDEFDDAIWQSIQFLASENGNRLVQVGGEENAPTVELAHEALVTAWPHYQSLLQEVAGEKRVLDDLITKAKRWGSANGADRAAQVASGADLEQFSRLASDRPNWLSKTEVDFVAASREREQDQQRRDRRLGQLTRVSIAVLLVGLGAITWLYLAAQRALDRATRSTATSLWNRLDFPAETGSLVLALPSLRSGDLSEDELNALWEVQYAPAALRRALIDELSSNPERVIRLGRRPASILRALQLDRSSTDAQAVWNRAFDVFVAARDGDERMQTAVGLAAAAEWLTSTQALEAWNRLTGLTVTAGEPSHRLALSALASQMTERQVDDVFESVLARADKPDQEWLLATLADRVSPSLAHTMLTALLSPTEPAWSDSPLIVREVYWRLAVRLDRRQASEWLDGFRQIVEQAPANGLPDPVRSRWLRLASVLPAVTRTAQPAAVERLSTLLLERFVTASEADVSVYSAALRAIRADAVKVPSPHALAAVRRAIAIERSQPRVGLDRLLLGPLLARLESAQLLDTLTMLLGQMKQSSSPDYYRLRAIVEEVARLIPEAMVPQAIEAVRAPRAQALFVALLSDVQVRTLDAQGVAAFTWLRDALSSDAGGIAPDDVRNAIAKLSPRMVVTPHVGARALHAARACVDARGVCRASYQFAAQMVVTPEQFESLHQTLVSVFSDEQSLDTFGSLTALATLFSRLPATMVPDILQQAMVDLRSDAGLKVWSVAGEELRALAPRLDATQADAAMQALVQRHMYRAGNDIVIALSAQLDPARAHAWLQDLLPSVEHDEKALIMRAEIIAALATRTDPADVPAAFAAGVRAMELDRRLYSLDEALESLASRIPVAARDRAIEQVKALAGWSRSDATRRTAATLLVRLWSHEPTDRFVRHLTEVLNYPPIPVQSPGGELPFSQSPAVAILLEALEARLPDAPGSDAGLRRNLAWIEAHYPNAGVNDLPRCPAPLWAGRSCPER